MGLRLTKHHVTNHSCSVEVWALCPLVLNDNLKDVFQNEPNATKTELQRAERVLFPPDGDKGGGVH